MDYQTAVKVSSGFGGGMMIGSVCGAVTGGMMAIGLKRGGIEQKVQLQTGVVVRQLVDQFKAKHRSVNCPDLTGFDIGKVDLSNPQALNEAYKNALANKAFAPCPAFVKDAATIVTELLNDAAKSG